MNGLHEDDRILDEERPTETTSLLSRHLISTPTVSQGSESDPWPSRSPVGPVIFRLQEQGLPTDYGWCPYTTTSVEKTAFILVALLQLRCILASQTTSAADVWDQWSREQRTTDILESATKQILETWSQFLSEAHTSDEVEELLWVEFPLQHNNPVTIRVIDLLSQPSGPEELVTHRVVLLSLTRTWKLGRTRSTREASAAKRLAMRFDGLCSPRVLHLLDFTLYSGYVALLAHYSLLPPNKPVEAESSHLSVRALLLVIYSLSHLIQAWSITTVPFLLALVAFISSLPSIPYPGDVAYSVILIALALHILQLQLPYAPGPLYLIPADQSLPIAILIWHGISRVFVPVVVFFLPALFIALFLLSTSLSDTLFQPFVLLTLNPSPMEARTTFLMLFALLFTLLLCSLLVLALIYPSVTSGPQPAYLWDRYSRPIGIEARQTFIRTVVLYSTAYRFVPPLNIVELVLVRTPAFVMRWTGQKHREVWLVTPRQVLWRILVGPFALLVAGVWVWGILV